MSAIFGDKLMKKQYEIIEIENCTVTVDVSLLSKTEEMFFNATEMAKRFGKKPNDFLRLDSTAEYIEEIVQEIGSGISRYEDLVKTKTGGRYQGTWMHKELVFEFAGWCSATFRRRLHKWVEKRIEQEQEWQRKRKESKTGFLPMTDAIVKVHDPVKFYHFSNECDLINKIVLGVSAKKFKERNGIDAVRDGLDAAQLAEINRLQIINTGLIEIGMSYVERKQHLIRCHQRELALL